MNLGAAQPWIERPLSLAAKSSQIILALGWSLSLSILGGWDAPKALPPQSNGSASQGPHVGSLGARPKDPFLIVPGRRLGTLKLNDTRQRALELFPRKPQIDQEYRYESFCVCGTEYEWVNLSPDDYGANMFIQFKDGLVSQIGSMLRKYHTSGGITVDSQPEEVRRQYEGLRAYVLFGTASRAVGDRPLTYWVDWKKGIAFSFGYDRDRQRRSIDKIIVFKPKGVFCPEGETSTPPNWQEIPPYTLEPPRELEERWRHSAD